MSSFDQNTTTAMHALEPITGQDGESRSLPYFSGLSGFRHCYPCFAKPNLSVLFYYFLVWSGLVSSSHDLVILFINIKRFNFKASHANRATVANTGQFTSIAQGRFHLAATDDGFIPSYPKLTRPAASATDAIANVAAFRRWVAHTAHIEVNRRFGVNRRRVNFENIKVVAVGESGPIAINENSIIDDLQGRNHGGLNRSTTLLSILRSFADSRKSITRIHEQLTLLGDGNGFTPLFRVITRYTSSLLLFERHSIRAETVKEQRPNSNDLNCCGDDVAHALPILSALGSTYLDRSRPIIAGLHLSGYGVTNKKQPPCVSSRLFRTDGVTAKRLLFIDDKQKRRAVLNAFSILDHNLKVKRQYD